MILSSRQIGLLGPEEVFGGLDHFHLLCLWFVMMLNSRLAYGDKGACAHQVVTHFGIPLSSIIRNRRQLAGLHLPHLLFLFSNLWERKLLNDLILIIRQFPAELLGLKSIDEL